MPSRSDLGPRPALGYTADALDRAAARRTDGAFLAAAETDPSTRLYAVGGEFVVLKKAAGGYDPLFAPDEARALALASETVFLGLAGLAARFAFGFDPHAAEALKERGDLYVSDLRAIATRGLIGACDLTALAEAKALLHWHARHRYCANCGEPTRATEAGWRRDCPACTAQHFPRTDPVVIMLASRGDRCLLGRQARFAPGVWSCLAGFVEPGETIEQAVRREVFEEAGVPCGRVAYFSDQPWPFPMSLMIGCHAEALREEIVVDRGELEDARWFDRDEVAAMLMRCHPDGLLTPPPVAIAHHIIRAWLEPADGS